MAKIIADAIKTQYVKVEQINSYIGTQVSSLDLSGDLKSA